MTYGELLKETAGKKRKAIADLNKALKGPAGFLVEAEIKKKPGVVAWAALAREFCEKLAEHIEEFMAEGEDTAHEVMQIYMAYEDGDKDLYCKVIVHQLPFGKISRQHPPLDPAFQDI